MERLREVTRLNLTLEFASACAGLTSLDAAHRLVAERLRWLIDFDVCRLALRVGGETQRLEIRSCMENLEVAAPGPTSDCEALVAQAFANGAPAAIGMPMTCVALPLGDLDAPIGVLCIEYARGYDHRDLRFLHHVCAALGAALRRTGESAAKDRFLAMLGHELRNPLAPIISAATLLERSASKEQRPVVQIVQRQTRHLQRLVEDLLDVARITEGQIVLQRGPIDLRDVAVQAQEMTRPLFEANRQRLELELPTDGVTVDGDDTRLVQVVANVLRNAALYSAASAMVRLRMHVDSNTAVVEVADEGTGIRGEMLPAIFERFVQAAHPHNGARGGLGLGLAVARELLRLHGGRIRADSEGEGRGSVFTITLPLMSAAPRGAPRPQAPAAPAMAPATTTATGTPPTAATPLGGVRVLVVDDNADAGFLVATLLGSAGAEVATVTRPGEALATVAVFTPHVVVLDLGLPEMDGYQLGGLLRERLGEHAPALVALSGFGQASDREKSRQQGFSAHLTKPASSEQLVRTVQQAVADGPAPEPATSELDPATIRTSGVR